MIDNIPKLQQLPAWKKLELHFANLKDRHLRDLFKQDPERGKRMNLDILNIHFDYSKHRIQQDTLDLLINLAEESELKTWIESMFQGKKINITEKRAALHVALRAQEEESLLADGINVVPKVQSALLKMMHFSQKIRSGSWKGYTGKAIRNIINIGIGGSDLGPVMAYEALKYYSQRNLLLRFVSNIDATDFLEATRDLNPEETLFIIVSKSFTTLETLTNAKSAKTWILKHFQDPAAIARHFVAVSANENAVRDFGIDTDNMFEFWDWVGGRYSLDSAVGLSLMLAIGYAHFHEMLEGFHDMDEHFLNSDFSRNLPVIMGLLTIWYNNFFGAQSIAVLPYAQYLKRFPAYLQQLTMESNGKHTTREGAIVNYQTGPVYWGEPGTNGQHSFYQLLHQGTKLVPCDFIGFIEALHPLGEHQDLLMANMFAQSEALAFGKKAEEIKNTAIPAWLIPHRTFAGNQPSSTFLIDKLDPRALGRLIAAYEHSVFTCSVIWQIDAFDEWGVELGKTLAKNIARELQMDRPSQESAHDSSTRTLLYYYRKGQTRIKGDQ